MAEEHVHDCDCGCEDEELVMLEDEQGNEIAFHYVTTLEYEGKEYVYLQLAESEDEEEADELEIYELQEVPASDTEEAHDSLYPVDDDLYEILYNKLMELIEEDDCECGGECHCHEHEGEHECHHDGCHCEEHEHNHDGCKCGHHHND